MLLFSFKVQKFTNFKNATFGFTVVKKSIGTSDKGRFNVGNHIYLIIRHIFEIRLKTNNIS